MLYSAAIGACAGIAVGLLFGGNILLIALLVGIAAAILFFGKRNPKALLCAAALACASLGLLRAQLYQASLAQEDVLRYLGESVVLKGVVATEPDRRDTTLHLTIAVKEIDGAPSSGRVLAFLPTNTESEYGAHVRIRGRLEYAEAFATTGGREFDYPNYLRAQGIVALLQNARLEESVPGGWSLQGTLFALKQRFEHSLERLVPQPQVALLQGVMLGERRGLPQDITDAFVETGLVHAVVLSGYNISIVASAVLAMLAFLPHAAALSVGAGMMILFAMMTGAGATTMRALIMALIAMLARYFHRSADAMRTLALAAAGLALWNPPALLYDPSYILSVLATFGLVALSPWMEALLLRVPLVRHVRLASLRSIAASTMAVQLFVLPALLYFTGVLSVLALPANLLALPVVPAIMLSGFIAGIAGFLHPILALPFVVVADLLLRWFLFVAQFTASLPFASATIAAFPAWVVVLLYIPLTYFAWQRYDRAQKNEKAERLHHDN